MKPDWLKITLPQGDNRLGQYRDVLGALHQYRLNTVCQSARCPNLSECWGRKTATFMILGDTCTRNCQFCAVKTGNPKGTLDPSEPERIAQAVRQLGLKYIVITSVTRDDLPDGGAEVFAETIDCLKQSCQPPPAVEVLIPDFNGDSNSLKKVLAAHPSILGHNVETVARLTPVIRDPQANYYTSLELLRKSKEFNPGIKTKSGFMVGLGETEDEIFTTLQDLKNVKVDIVTIGQYLQPTKKHLPVKNYVKPEQFENFRKYGLDLGFKAVFSGPLVRSSYRADSLRLF
jgi:lipoyl synthase